MGYSDNIVIMKSLGLEVKDGAVLSENEAALCARIAKLQEGRTDIAQCLENAIVAMQAAYIAGHESPGKTMEWIHNYLWGPGLIPSDEEIHEGAQAFSDKHHKF